MAAANCRISVRVFSGRGHRGGGPSAPPPPAQPANCRGEAKTVAPLSRWLPPFKARPLQPRLCGFFFSTEKNRHIALRSLAIPRYYGKGPGLIKKRESVGDSASSKWKVLPRHCGGSGTQRRSSARCDCRRIGEEAARETGDLHCPNKEGFRAPRRAGAGCVAGKVSALFGVCCVSAYVFSLGLPVSVFAFSLPFCCC